MRCLLIADDLTGACDAAVQFRLRGAKTRVGLSFSTEPCDVLALSTDTRGLEDAEMRLRIQSVAQQYPRPEAVFKKIDSLWRGNPEREIEAAMNAFQCDIAVVTPAFPAMGRRVVNGRLLVDPLPNWEPIDVPALDASTDDDLRRIVREGKATGKRILWAGSAGLAGAIAQDLFPDRDLPVLFVIGSDHEVTQQQEAALRAQRSSGYRIVLELSAHEPARALLLSGGDTAALVCGAIGAESIILEGEIAPGLPWGHIVGGLYDGVPVATKSGAFGDPDALIKVLDYFRYSASLA